MKPPDDPIIRHQNKTLPTCIPGQGAGWAPGDVSTHPLSASHRG